MRRPTRILAQRQLLSEPETDIAICESWFTGKLRVRLSGTRMAVYHQMIMRRGCSIFLILFFGLGPLTALAEGTEDAGLPACCRRHGAHHCDMSAQIKDAQTLAMRAGLAVDSTPGFSAPPTCPLYHWPAIFTLMPTHALVAVPPSFRPEFRRAPAPAFERIAVFSRPIHAHAGRGPPIADLT